MSAQVAAVVERTFDEHRIRCDVTDGPVLTKSYGSGRQYRPTGLSVTYSRMDGGPWEVVRVVLSGPNVKKDGSDGGGSNNETLWSTSWSSKPWIVAVVEANMPGADQ